MGGQGQARPGNNIPTRLDRRLIFKRIGTGNAAVEVSFAFCFCLKKIKNWLMGETRQDENEWTIVNHYLPAATKYNPLTHSLLFLHNTYLNVYILHCVISYQNRNASSPMTNETLLKSYSAAVGSAIVVAFGLSTFVQKRFPAEKAKQMMKFVAFPSAVVASSLNCYVVRSPEIATGVPLMDANGKTVLEEERSNVSDCCQTGRRIDDRVSCVVASARLFFAVFAHEHSPTTQKSHRTQSPNSGSIDDIPGLGGFWIGIAGNDCDFPASFRIESERGGNEVSTLDRPDYTKTIRSLLLQQGIVVQ